jgi:drug/metabolite transporter (DMT)-like permease
MSHPCPRKVVYAALTCSAFLWGSGFAVARFALRSVSPLGLWAGAGVFSAATQLAWSLSRGQWRGLRLPAAVFWPVVALGLVGQNVLCGLTYLGLARTTATNAGLLYGSSPVIITLFAALFLREPLGRRKIAGALAGLLGVALIITQAQLGGIRLHGVMLGNLVVFGAAVYWAAYSVATRSITQTVKAEAFTFYLILLGAIGPVAWVWCRQGHSPVAGVDLPTLAAMAFMGIGNTVVGMNLWNWGLEHIEASRVGVFSYLEPVFASLTAAIFLGERFTLWSALGATLVFTGIFLSTTDKASLGKT